MFVATFLEVAVEHICAYCGQPIIFGKPAVQMLEGPWYSAITPAYTSLHAEWHRDCFHDFELKEQSLPYKCQDCGNEISFGETIVFLIIGEETDSYSTVAEKRGDTIYSPKHRRCSK
jgi:hypothetical protein